jgi:hypothetical protein
MNNKGAAADVMARHLRTAIDQVREDVAKVEFWADAMTGFSAPVPDYGADDVKVWLPPEQATRIASANQNVSQQKTTSSKRR